MWDDELEEIINSGERIYLKIKCDCVYCSKEKPLFLEVKASEENGVSIKDAIEAMVMAEYKPECAYIVLTGFEKLSEEFFRPIFEL